MTVDAARARLEAARLRHRDRSLGSRVLTVVGGGLAGLAGAALVLPIPELGLPLLVVGLRLLALEYAWAARAYVPVLRIWNRVRALSTRRKIMLAAIAALVVVAIVWWLA